ncbi:GNAT family N-acetyltransferase [Xylophilus rhododendri]|uniref:GNAT family N-acetyltransferase n=1 Tax=Xylophilus rhododendri TaxID=2697032 RepID=A0A857J6E1_9BURK|nr:GNAT family protein [Xylophilus rhododendri]QHI99386.1 GNAT family N-acetyltransferase [Xylophilus rhododendri]
MTTALTPLQSPFESVHLRGPFASLEPLTAAHAAEAREAVAEGEIWRQWTTDIPAPEAVEAEIERRLGLQRAGRMLPFTVRDAAGRFAGMTTFMEIDAANRRLEIGSTWYRPSVRRTALNTQAKRLLLGHAFDGLGCVAVEFRTHFFNHASRAAIARLGAKQDGILRNHRITKNGTLRDTVVFSILDTEWPTVRAHLQFQLDRPRET